MSKETATLHMPSLHYICFVIWFKSIGCRDGSFIREHSPYPLGCLVSFYITALCHKKMNEDSKHIATHGGRLKKDHSR